MPSDGTPVLLAVLFSNGRETGIGIGIDMVDEVEDDSEGAAGDSAGVGASETTGGDCGVSVAVSVSSFNPSSSSGRGRCSATKVSLPDAETPFSLHVRRISSRLFVNSH